MSDGMPYGEGARLDFIEASTSADDVLDTLEGVQAAHPNIADYRLTEALSAARTLARYLGYLASGEHSPEFTAAMAQARRTLGLAGGEA